MTLPARNIVVIGDSIAAGYGLPRAYAWPQLLIQQLSVQHPQFRWQLYNESIPGDATPDAYVRFDAVRRRRPHLAIFALGINDCRRAESPVVARRIEHFRYNEQTWWGGNPLLRRIGYRLMQAKPSASPNPAISSQTPLEDFVAILGWMVTQMQDADALPALMALSPLAPQLARSPDFAHCQRYNQAIRDIARETGAAFIPTHFPNDSGVWQVDGVHLSVLGQAQLAQCVLDSFLQPPIASHLGLEAPAAHV